MKIEKGLFEKEKTFYAIISMILYSIGKEIFILGIIQYFRICGSFKYDVDLHIYMQ